MKIAVLGTRGFPGVQGGVEAHCEKLYPRLADIKCRITVFTRSPYVDTSLKLYKGVDLVAINCPRSRSFEAIIHTFKGVLAARRIRPDILHFHAVGPSLLVPLARILGMRVVMTNHGPDYKREKWGFFARMALRCGEALGSLLSNEIICISRTIADEIKQRYKRSSFVIPNGVEMPDIVKAGEALRKYSLEKGKYILLVGRFVPEKGFHDVIKAFNIAGFKDRKLVIAGGADHESEYSRGLKKNAEKNDNIILTGFLTGRPLQELYSHAGLFVLPSYYEGLPIALLEAMSYGLQCVASDIPANRAVGLPDENYYAAGDIEQLSGKIAEFSQRPLSDSQKSSQINDLQDKYNWDKIAKETLKVYEKAVSGK